MTISEDDNITLFVDTNTFLQLRDVKDLPWKELFPNVKRLEVTVCPRITEELDRFKNDPIQRRRKRSRLALQSIKTAARSVDREVLLRSTPYEIVLKLSETRKLDWDAHPNLDSSKPDDHLVLEALSHSPNAIVFSDDTGPYVQATAIGLKAADPKEGWHLQREPSSEELKIKVLERELLQAKATAPQIESHFENLEDGICEFIIPKLPPLDKAISQRMIAAYLKVYPQAVIYVPPEPSWMIGASFHNRRITQVDADSYSRDYGRFKQRVKTLFENLHERIEKSCLAHPIWVNVKNSGSVAAKGLRIDLEISGEAYLLANEKEAGENSHRIAFPSPPEKPQPRSPFDVPNLHSHLLANRDFRRDPTRFYWEDRPSYGATRSSRQCEDFRAKEVYRKDYWICAYSLEDAHGSITAKISATNMREPISIRADFIFKEVEMDWTDSRLHSLLPEPLGDVLKSV